MTSATGPSPSVLPVRGQLCSPVGCRRERLDRVVPAIWGGEVILIRLHPPLQCGVLLRISSRIVWLLCCLQRPSPLQPFLFVRLTCQAEGEGAGRCQSCRWKTGACGELRTFLDPVVEGRAIRTRPEEQHSGWKHGFPRWATLCLAADRGIWCRLPCPPGPRFPRCSFVC